MSSVLEVKNEVNGEERERKREEEKGRKWEKGSLDGGELDEIE